jgi:hypothetical protein
MKARCVFNKHTEVPELIEKYGYLPGSVNYITKGKEYVIFAILCSPTGVSTYSSIEYMIRDDLNDVSNYSAMLFEITDSYIGDEDWHINYMTKHVDFVLSSKDFANDIHHYEGVLLREHAERDKFMGWCKQLEDNQALRDAKKQQ